MSDNFNIQDFKPGDLIKFKFYNFCHVEMKMNILEIESEVESVVDAGSKKERIGVTVKGDQYGIRLNEIISHQRRNNENK